MHGSLTFNQLSYPPPILSVNEVAKYFDTIEDSDLYYSFCEIRNFMINPKKILFSVLVFLLLKSSKDNPIV